MDRRAPTLDGVPLAAKIHVEISPQPASAPETPASAPVEDETPLQVNVRGKREHKAQRNVSDFVVDRDTLSASSAPVPARLVLQ